METTNSPPQLSVNHLNNATSDDYSPETHLSPPPVDETSQPAQPEPTPANDDAVLQPPKKRRRRMKQFPEMIPSAGLRVHRAPKSTHGAVEIDDAPSKNRRRRRSSDLSKEVDTEALIAISVGFPVDSLTEEEIEANVVSQIGGAEQANYIVVRNHILARWRSNVSIWLTRDHAFESIRVEHRSLVSSAYAFLLEHGYINFGLAPSIREAKSRPPEGGARASVIIIGAGIAGLVAARQLIFLGFKVVVLEGRTRPGGRIRTKKMTGGVGGVVAAADLGGSVLTGINGNPLGVLARQLEFPLHKLNRQNVSLGTALEAFRHVYKVAEDPQERMLLNWHLANLEYANATLMSNLSMAFWDQDDPYEMGGDHCFIPGGNERFIWALADDLPIFYDRRVESIRYGVDGVLVYANGQGYRGDMVLCTASLGVLKKGSIEFVPELPQRKKDAIERLGFGLLNKVAMLFPYAFWGGEIDTFGHLTEDSSMRGEFFLFYSYSSVSGGPLLVALVAGEAAIKFEKMSPVEAVERVLEILRGIFNPKGVAVPNPIQAVCTRWGQDQFAYGSYSYVAIGASGDDYDILSESIGDGRVFFAGEATNKQYPATMHGAFLSGMREAANMLRVANRRSLVPAEKSNNVNGESDAAGKLFETPDLKFGSFSILFDPRSNDPESNSLLQVEFRGEKLDSGCLRLYCLIQRKQAIELNEVDGDVNRMKLLNRDFQVRLVGRRSLCSSAESLITYIKSARSNLN
ncbi:LSD1-like 1 [Actinidia rufa]|uniref:LSD1-like 1 n=1 Tax=Actinidia rufa TaxID=165716 RepID=A0A7J0EUG3_9ERIC|nr:LSD1-like 1 [Actinidia rufa]